MHKNLEVDSQVYIESSHTVREMKRQVLNGQNIDTYLFIYLLNHKIFFL